MYRYAQVYIYIYAYIYIYTCVHIFLAELGNGDPTVDTTSLARGRAPRGPLATRAAAAARATRVTAGRLGRGGARKAAQDERGPHSPPCCRQPRRSENLARPIGHKGGVRSTRAPLAINPQEVTNSTLLGRLCKPVRPSRNG